MKEGAPLRAKSVPSKVRAYGPGLEPVGVAAKAPANFTVETFGAGDGELSIRWSEQNEQHSLFSFYFRFDIFSKVNNLKSFCFEGSLSWLFNLI
jgi:hypothetical protein